MKAERSLAIVTVYLMGSEEELIETIKSIDEQTVAVDEHILVISGVEDELGLKKQFQSTNRIIILNQDTSLYDAMNIGLSNVTAEFVFFLNGGDLFLTSSAVRVIKSQANDNTCLLFRTAQCYADDIYVRPKKSRLNSLLKYPAHQGFVAPSAIAKKYPFCDSPNAISSDTLWMKKIISKCTTKLITDTLVTFSLGGVSNRPSIKTCKIRLIESGVIRFGLECVKLVLSKVVGLKVFYRVIFFLKYEHNYKIPSNRQRL